ncbi:MAG: trigger factor [Eubacterium sp.]|jgi:trigger factor
MSVQVEKLENSTVKLTIEVPAEQFDAAMQDVYNRQKKNISIPGFRKGKVPRQMVERMYGPEVFYDDAANQIMPQAYSDAAKESGEDIMSRPTVDIVQIEKGKPFIFTAEVAVRPDVKLGEYKGVEVTKIDTEVSDEEVETELNNERERNARTITVEDRAIQSGDTAVIDFEGFADGKAFEGGKGENHNLEIGSGSFIPGFEDQLIGKNSGDEVEVNVTFPEDYHAEDLKGKDAVFKVKIHEVKAKELPEADDEFAQDVSEFDTIAEYRDSIRKKLEERKADMAKNEQKQEAIDKIVEASEMELPDAIVLTRADEIINQFAQQLAQQGLSMDQYMQYAGTDIDQLRDSVRPEAVTRIKNQLVIDAIAKAENIEITDAEVEEELKKMAEMYNMELDKLKGYMTEEETENMKLDLASQKALDLVYDNAVFVDAPEEEKTEEAEAEAAEE